MFTIILRQLTIWRNSTAQKMGVDFFRVLPNKTLEELAIKQPKNKTELLQIKGIKEAKYNQYGLEILQIIKANSSLLSSTDQTPPTAKSLTISQFLNTLNQHLNQHHVKITGEVTTIDHRPQVIYFTLQDKEDQSVINCIIFQNQYQTLGIKLQIGLEITAEGYAEIYKPYGRLSFKAHSLELLGDGQLKQEYEKLKKHLTEQGIFAATNKIPITSSPTHLGLITSREGAAIGDFMSNIGQYGLKIHFVHSSVEGRKAVFELMTALKILKQKKVDVIIIIRGGGSLESLQAFNNEALIQATKKLSIPIICGVGHEKDISLLSLSADIAVSTPTAAAQFINTLWEQDIKKLTHLQQQLSFTMHRYLQTIHHQLNQQTVHLKHFLPPHLTSTQHHLTNFKNNTRNLLQTHILHQQNEIQKQQKNWQHHFITHLQQTNLKLEALKKEIQLQNPTLKLKQGYALISQNNRTITKIKNLQPHQTFTIQMQDGQLSAQVPPKKTLLTPPPLIT